MRRLSASEQTVIWDRFRAGKPWLAGSPEQSHNPKVAGSNPAPATKETLWYPTFQRVSSRPEYGGQDSSSATFFPKGWDSEH